LRKQLKQNAVHFVYEQFLRRNGWLAACSWDFMREAQ
jgi:hypothetical protein